MTRGHGWRFLDMGRRTERADSQTVKLIRNGLGFDALRPEPPEASVPSSRDRSDSTITLPSARIA